mmetsp:Transcript_48998/g.147580  ORF Transcript_48998/g.147580 Transcript_48998/m.147580 type:complete len:265 (-) Transcript_48998:272-1066(-)
MNALHPGENVTITKAACLVFLLVAIAPLQSLHFAFRTWGGEVDDGSVDVVSPDDRIESAASSEERIMHEMLTKILMGRPLNGMTHAFAAAGIAEDPFRSTRYFSVVLPWFVSLVLATGGGIAAFVRERRRQRDARRYISRLGRKDKRLARLILCTRDFRRKLRESDERKASVHSGTRVYKEEEERSFLIPSGEKGKRAVELCAVCLSRYKAGDTIIWSSNDQCSHAFHEQCIISWLMKNRKLQCPCCRQNFIDPNKYHGTDVPR